MEENNSSPCLSGDIQRVPERSSFVVSMGSYLDVSNWLNPAKLTLYYQTNSSSQWVQDYCGQRTTEPCEQLCDQDTGECSCLDGYAPDPEHEHLCVRTDWGRNEGSSYSLGQGLWLPVSKSFVVPPVELSINPIASCKTDVLVTEDPGEVRSWIKRDSNFTVELLIPLRGLGLTQYASVLNFSAKWEEAMMSTYFETVDDLLASFGPVRDCSKDNGGCRKNFKCVSDRRLDSSGCMCPEGLRPMKDGSGCYDYSLGTDCTDGFNGGCEQLCLQQLVPLPDDPSASNVLMFCGCVQEYKLAADSRSCILLDGSCDGGRCPRPDATFNDTLFGEMLRGYENKTQRVNLGQVFQMTFRSYSGGFSHNPVRSQSSGDAQFSEGMGYPMVQQWRVRSNLYKVKLSAITLSTGFSKVLKAMTADSSREELLSFIQQYGSHYVSEALYGSELTCNIYFPSKRAQQQLWLQYQKDV
ncbi:hypothetical protein P4O66_002787 [Electrophorus voltai]|uniref:MACPF domain-containing protein n=1 Tax=Electrophorus voltai TaxID=2609070 RepID=A0AAD9DML5_9TELE|nr:hypothetical protein P4O66_002787 [Electrophorus voltai]